MRTNWVIHVISALLVLAVGVASAQVATFQVDPSASSLTVSGTAAGAPIQQQGPGSLTTTYQGSLLVELESGAINFPGGSAVTANNSGNWQPLPGGASGSAPANYGGRVVILFQNNFAAVRDSVFDGTTLEALTLTGANSATFAPNLTFTATSGTIDYNSPLAGNGSQSIVGETGANASANSGTLNIVPAAAGSASATLGLPISFTIITDLLGTGDGIFNFNGSITARATAAAGDANFDGNVNLDDFNTLAANFGTNSGAGWLSADFDFNGNVNLDDFNALAGNFGLSARPGGPTPDDWSALSAVVPEPQLVGLVVLSSVMVKRRRARGEASPVT